MTKKMNTEQKGGRATERRILVAGLAESERDSLLSMILRGGKKQFPKLALVKLPDFSGLSMTSLETKRTAFHRKFGKVLQKKGNLIVSGSLVCRTAFGFAPLFTPPCSFRPDMTILLEIDAHDAVYLEYGIAKRVPADISIMQQLNRYYTTAFSQSISILPVMRGNIKKALRELRALLMVGLSD